MKSIFRINRSNKLMHIEIKHKIKLFVIKKINDRKEIKKIFFIFEHFILLMISVFDIEA
jgi:hypothetical protein